MKRRSLCGLLLKNEKRIDDYYEVRIGVIQWAGKFKSFLMALDQKEGFGADAEVGHEASDVTDVSAELFADDGEPHGAEDVVALPLDVAGQVVVAVVGHMLHGVVGDLDDFDQGVRGHVGPDDQGVLVGDGLMRHQTRHVI